MVTNARDYEEMLWQIQSNAPITKALLLPTDEKIYEIDLDTRTISVPEFLSVEKDHYAETIFFKFDRYYERTDLTTKACIIQYVNAEGKSFVYPVPFYDIETYALEDKVLIPWCIQGAATAAAGTVKFSICFYSIDVTKKLTYSLNTLVASGKILKGQNATDIEDLTQDSIVLDNSLLELIQELQAAKNNGTLAVFWLDV